MSALELRARRRKLAQLLPRINEAVRTETRAGYCGGLDPDEMVWLVDELRIAWAVIRALEASKLRDRRRLARIARRLEEA